MASAKDQGLILVFWLLVFGRTTIRRMVVACYCTVARVASKYHAL